MEVSTGPKAHLTGLVARSLAVAAFAAVFVMACTVPNPSFDPTTIGPQETIPLPEGWQPTPFGEQDQVFVPVPWPDQDQPAPEPDPVYPEEPEPEEPEEPEAPAPPAPPTGGLGALCTDGQPCGAGELCLYMTENATKGICLQKCDNPNEFCPVSDPSFVAGCSTYFNSDIGSVNVCAIFCRFKTETFPCPDNVNYRCKDYGPYGVCVPKS